MCYYNDPPNLEQRIIRISLNIVEYLGHVYDNICHMEEVLVCGLRNVTTILRYIYFDIQTLRYS